MEEQFGMNAGIKIDSEGIGERVFKYLSDQKKLFEDRRCIITINIIDVSLIPAPQPEPRERE